MQGLARLAAVAAVLAVGTAKDPNTADSKSRGATVGISIDGDEDQMARRLAVTSKTDNKVKLGRNDVVKADGAKNEAVKMKFDESAAIAAVAKLKNDRKEQPGSRMAKLNGVKPGNEVAVKADGAKNEAVKLFDGRANFAAGFSNLKNVRSSGTANPNGYGIKLALEERLFGGDYSEESDSRDERDSSRGRDMSDYDDMERILGDRGFMLAAYRILETYYRSTAHGVIDRVSFHGAAHDYVQWMASQISPKAPSCWSGDHFEWTWGHTIAIIASMFAHGQPSYWHETKWQAAHIAQKVVDGIKFCRCISYIFQIETPDTLLVATSKTIEVMDDNTWTDHFTDKEFEELVQHTHGELVDGANFGLSFLDDKKFPRCQGSALVHELDEVYDQGKHGDNYDDFANSTWFLSTQLKTWPHPGAGQFAQRESRASRIRDQTFADVCRLINIVGDAADCDSDSPDDHQSSDSSSDPYDAFQYFNIMPRPAGAKRFQAPSRGRMSGSSTDWRQKGSSTGNRWRSIGSTTAG